MRAAVDDKWLMSVISNSIDADSVLDADGGRWDRAGIVALAVRVVISVGIGHLHSGGPDDSSDVGDELGPDFLPLAVAGVDLVVVCVSFGVNGYVDGWFEWVGLPHCCMDAILSVMKEGIERRRGLLVDERWKVEGNQRGKARSKSP